MTETANMLLARLLNHLIAVGSLIVIDANGATHTFQGTARRDRYGVAPPPLTVRLHDPVLHSRLYLNPQLTAGEAYTNGTMTIEDGDIYDLLDLVGRNLEIVDWPAFTRLAGWAGLLFRRLHQFNPLGLSKAHVARHYDLSGEMYDLFLDSDRQYSCAFFESPNDDLETAQDNKKRLIARKLLLRPGYKVLDIGSGWGGLALYLARTAGVEVDGLTLSEEQVKVSRAHADEAGLGERVRFYLRDYREHRGRYDRIVSVGMFEHVGIGYYPKFFAAIHDLLTDDGIALLHTIGRSAGPGVTDPWIRKYIFPGGYSPALSEISQAIEQRGLIGTDIEVLRLHYAETLRHWRQRFQKNRGKAAALYDERFCRMWEYYLAASEMSFRHMDSVVFHIQMARRADAVPMTRGYLLGDGIAVQDNIKADRVA